MNIKITASNAIELDQFIPVDGAWSIEDKQDSDSIIDVKERCIGQMADKSLANYLGKELS